jgi:hypothetical protein
MLQSKMLRTKAGECRIKTWGCIVQIIEVVESRLERPEDAECRFEAAIGTSLTANVFMG